MITTLPGDIPGLIRNASPCITSIGKRVTIRVNPDGDYPGLPLTEIRLDLREPTGREHAARWVRACTAESAEAWRSVTVEMLWWLVVLAESRADMTPEQIDSLARLVLRLAGRTP